jgi:hypothetical protein
MVDWEILAVAKNQADWEILAVAENQTDGKIPASRENKANGKILAGVEISPPNEILAELEKQAVRLLFRLGGISNCWLLPGPADEHVLFLIDVMNLACSLQVRNGLLVPSFYGRTLLPYCTGCLYWPAMLKMVKSLAPLHLSSVQVQQIASGYARLLTLSRQLPDSPSRGVVDLPSRGVTIPFISL